MTQETKEACPQCGAPLKQSKSNLNRGQVVKCRRCYRREWYEKNVEAVKTQSKEYYKKTADRRRAVSRQTYWNLSPTERKRRNREMCYRGKYGISLEQYEAMVMEQKGLCFLCGKPPKSGDRLHVDHCHKHKTVRRLLCKTCNFFLGVIERDPAWVTRAIEYLCAGELT